MRAYRRRAQRERGREADRETERERLAPVFEKITPDTSGVRSYYYMYYYVRLCFVHTVLGRCAMQSFWQFYSVLMLLTAAGFCGKMHISDTA